MSFIWLKFSLYSIHLRYNKSLIVLTYLNSYKTVVESASEFIIDFKVVIKVDVYKVKA